MNKKITYLFKDGKEMEIKEEPAKVLQSDPNPVGRNLHQIGQGYWRSDGAGNSEMMEIYFSLESNSPVMVSTDFSGDVRLSLATHNQTTNQSGPTFPKTGGKSSLNKGNWYMYFLGSIGKGYINVYVYKE